MLLMFLDQAQSDLFACLDRLLRFWLHAVGTLAFFSKSLIGYDFLIIVVKIKQIHAFSFWSCWPQNYPSHLIITLPWPLWLFWRFVGNSDLTLFLRTQYVITTSLTQLFWTLFCKSQALLNFRAYTDYTDSDHRLKNGNWGIFHKRILWFWKE